MTVWVSASLALRCSCSECRGTRVNWQLAELYIRAGQVTYGSNPAFDISHGGIGGECDFNSRRKAASAALALFFCPMAEADKLVVA